MSDNEKINAGDELSMLQAEERKAITADVRSTLAVVSGLRRYRAAARKLMDSRREDGGCSGESMAGFAEEIALIESLKP